MKYNFSAAERRLIAEQQSRTSAYGCVAEALGLAPAQCMGPLGASLAVMGKALVTQHIFETMGQPHRRAEQRQRMQQLGILQTPARNGRAAS